MLTHNDLVRKSSFSNIDKTSKTTQMPIINHSSAAKMQLQIQNGPPWTNLWESLLGSSGIRHCCDKADVQI